MGMKSPGDLRERGSTIRFFSDFASNIINSKPLVCPFGLCICRNNRLLKIMSKDIQLSRDKPV